MLTIADGGGGGVQEPLIWADVICEQPLINAGIAIGADRQTGQIGQLPDAHSRGLRVRG